MVYTEGWGYNQETEYLPSTCEAMGSCPALTNKLQSES